MHYAPRVWIVTLGLIAIAAASLLLPQVYKANAQVTPFEAFIDCDTSTTTIESECTLPSGTTSAEVNLVFTNVSGADFGVSAGGGIVVGDNGVVFSPVVPASCTPPALDCNPDFNQDGIQGSFNCGAPAPEPDLNPDPLITESFIGCATGAPEVGFFVDGSSMVFITVRYNVNTDGTGTFSMRNVTLYEENFTELMSCEPIIINEGACFGATITVGETATATPTTVPDTATPTATDTATTVPDTATPTPTDTPTIVPDTATPTPTDTPTTVPDTATATPTDTTVPDTETPTPTTVPDTETPVPTDTPTSVSATDTPVPTSTNTPEPTDTPDATDTPVPTSTNTPEPTDTPAATDTPVATSTNTPEPTDTPAATDTPVPTSTNTPVPTDTPAATDTPVPTSTNTPQPTATSTPPVECLTLGQKLSLTIGVLLRYGAEEGERRYSPKYDFNDDGRIDVGDIADILETPTCRRR